MQDVKIETVKAVPAVAGAAAYGITLNELVAIATLGYIALQAAYLVWKWRRESRGGGNSQSGKGTRSVAVAFASAGGLAALMALASPVIQGFEGKTNHAVIPVPGDVPTICHGHTKTAAMGQIRTDAECEKLLQQDLTESFNAVARHVKVDLPAETWVALASFEFNIGEGSFARSTAVKKINAGDLQGGCEAIAAKEIVNGRCSGYGCGWSGGRQVKGLQNRRITEREMCLKGLVPKVVVTAEPPWWKFWARWV